MYYLKEFGEVELIHKKSQTQEIEEKLSGLREDLNSLLIEQAKGKLKRGRRTLYEFGNKPSRMLAKALKDTTTQRYMSGIKTQKDRMVSSSKEMAQIFKEYYEGLYQLEGQLSPEKSKSKLELAREYLQTSGMPKLTEETAQELDVPITVEEFKRALNLLKLGKAPGPDGYTLAYYRFLRRNWLRDS